ncbi:MAG: hypothetical protein N3F66_01700 [Spirochaetes bacterium]|nr:hypothetical protein [Spirochaetota bacterium]
MVYVLTVICNCHPKSCVSLKATQFAKRFDSSLSMNALAVIDKTKPWPLDIEKLL